MTISFYNQLMGYKKTIVLLIVIMAFGIIGIIGEIYTISTPLEIWKFWFQHTFRIFPPIGFIYYICSMGFVCLDF